VAFPILWLARLSILPETLLIELPPPWLFTPSLAGYREVLTLHPFVRYLRNSLVVAVCSSAGPRAGAGRVQPCGFGITDGACPAICACVMQYHDHSAVRI
jgi:hypothetical protein